MSNTQLTNQDLRFVVSRIPKDVRSLLQTSNIILAGGFIRSTIAGEKVSDIDLLGPDKEILKSNAYFFATQRKARVYVTENALTVLSPPRFPVQFITRWVFDSPNRAIESFDFTVAKAAIWYSFNEKLWKSCIDEAFYPDLAARRLVYTSPIRNEDAGGSLLRVRKFLSRGYTIQAPSLAAVMARLFMAINFDKLESYTETTITHILSGLLREVDPNTVVDGFDFVDEHQVIIDCNDKKKEKK